MWRKSKNSPALAGIFGLLLAGCSLISFDYLSLTSPLAPGEEWFEGEYLILDFSILPDKEDVENQIQLKTQGSSLDPLFEWQGLRLLIRPFQSWKPGQAYTCALEGSLKMQDQRTYGVRFFRSFRYGQPNQDLRLDSWTVEPQALILVFNKPPSISSFNEKFSILPGIDKITEVSADRRTLTLRIQNGWKANAFYTFTLSELAADDGFLMDRRYQETFSGPEDRVIPFLAKVCPVKLEPAVYWQENKNLDGGITSGDAIGFLFSKSMDPPSVQGGISFSPSLKGHFVQESGDRFLFVPEENFQPGKNYRITLAASLKDEAGVEFFEAVRIFFTPADYYLKVLTVHFDNQENLVAGDSSGNPNGGVFDYPLAASGRLMAVFGFSRTVPPELRRQAVEAVSLTPLFPSSAGSPSLLAAEWEPSGSAVSLTWEGFTKSQDDIKNYYRLVLRGGQSGITASGGEYLEEDLWLVFIAQ
ncbi:MAG: Ig-like domain-containing protein [Spirochaetales bacterium]|jgi:hypothetical protein|nr:Ig-like domain-containing protein [Spirochaetales bacterium]